LLPSGTNRPKEIDHKSTSPSISVNDEAKRDFKKSLMPDKTSQEIDNKTVRTCASTCSGSGADKVRVAPRDDSQDTQEFIQAVREASELELDPTMWVEVILMIMGNSDVANKDTQSYSLEQMQEASKKDSAYASAFVTSRAAHDVLGSMKRFSTDSSIQSTACGVKFQPAGSPVYPQEHASKSWKPFLCS
jgi:trehalose/maltose hydrolase-like predicted phosphorylase